MSRHPGRVALATAFAAALPAAGMAAARTEAPGGDGPALEVVGACPGAASVRRRLAGLLSAAGAPAPAISIQDRGVHYRIAVGAEATTLYDPGRDCEARARHAAVIVANGLRSHPQVFGPPVWTVEKGLVFEVSSGAGGPAWAPGAEIRGAYGSGRWSLVGAAGARAPVTLSFEGAWKAEVLRLPVDAGLRLTRHEGRLRPWLVLAPSVTLTGILGQDLLQTEREWRLDPGAIAMIGATLPLRKRLGVAAAISARWQPRTYRLEVDPVGKVGETPLWWFGLSLNYTIDGPPSSP
jgi:hypothetical protein